MGGISNIDREAAVSLSCTEIRFVERARFLRIQFEPRKDSGRLGSTRRRSLSRFHDRGDSGGRIGDRGFGAVEGTDEDFSGASTSDRAAAEGKRGDFKMIYDRF